MFCLRVLTAKQLYRNHTSAWACNFIKKETLTQVLSCQFCEIFKNIFLHKTPLVTASGNTSSEIFHLFMVTDDSKGRRGNKGTIFNLFTNLTCFQTFRNLFAIMHLRRLPLVLIAAQLMLLI